MGDWKTRMTMLGRAVLPLVVVAGGVVGLAVFGRPPGVAKEPTTGPEAALVQVAHPRPFTGEIVLQRDGVTGPFRRVTLAAEVSGRIVEKSDQARSGRFVESGQLLFRIDPTDYLLRVRQLEVQRDQADEDIRAVDVDLENTQRLIVLAERQWDLEKRQLARAQRLAAQNAISENGLEEAQRAELTARNNYQTLVNQRDSLQQRRRTLLAARALIETQLEEARVDLQRTEVRAPLSGTVVKDHVESGDFVKLGDPLIEISEAGKKEVRCSLSLTDLMWIWMAAGVGPRGEIPPQRRFEVPPTPAEVVLTLKGREYVWSGILSRYDGTGLDVETRMVPCRVLVDGTEPVAIRDATRTLVRTDSEKDERPVGAQPAAAATGETLGQHAARGVETAAADGSGSPRETADAGGASDAKAGERIPGPPTLFSGAYVKLQFRVRPQVRLWEIPEAALKPGNELWVVRNGRLRILPAPVARIEGARVLLWRSRCDLREGDLLVTSPLPAAFDGLPVRVADDALRQTSGATAPRPSRSHVDADATR